MSPSKLGTHTEQLILGVCPIYEHEAIGSVAKRDPATAWSAKLRGPIYIQSGEPDFSGHWRGMAFELEAKEVSRGDRFRFDHPEKVQKQILALERFARSGALSFMLIHFTDKIREAYLWPIRRGDRQQIERCPFLQWALKKTGAPKSITLEWCRENAHRVHEKRGGLDWGDAMDRILIAKS